MQTSTIFARVFTVRANGNIEMNWMLLMIQGDKKQLDTCFVLPFDIDVFVAAATKNESELRRWFKSKASHSQNMQTYLVTLLGA